MAEAYARFAAVEVCSLQKMAGKWHLGAVVLHAAGIHLSHVASSKSPATSKSFWWRELLSVLHDCQPLA